MNDSLQDLRKKLGGISANKVILPMILLFIVVQGLIISTFSDINKMSAEMTQTQRSYHNYIQEASSIIGGSSLLSETSTNFVLSPLNEAGEINVAPLMAYAQEFPSDRRPNKVIENFRTYNVSDEVMDYLLKTGGAAQYMIDSQLHAIALVGSVYPIPSNPALDALPLPQLTPQEIAMPEEARLGLARSLVFGTEYQQNKASVSQNSGMCVETLGKELEMYSRHMSERVLVARHRMWVYTLIAVILLVVSFIGIYRLFLRPIKVATKSILKDEEINEKLGIQEFRIMSNSYNNLLFRRNALDGILRSAASIDTLTGLENRYAFESYSLDADEEEGPLGVAYFDVNYLKKTNDENGHAAGDKLLIDSAQCITDIFGADEGNNCFRIGGDEFVAILPKVNSEKEIDEMVERFKAEQAKKNVSIAWGCVYTDDISRTSIKHLLEVADARLYECKRKMHEQGEMR